MLLQKTTKLLHAIDFHLDFGIPTLDNPVVASITWIVTSITG